MRYLNLQLKDGVEPSELLQFGFAPKYNEDTGEIKEYRREIVIDRESAVSEKKYFVFVVRKSWLRRGFKRFEYDAWMTGFSWSDVATTECMQLLYDLFTKGIAEPAEV